MLDIAPLLEQEFIERARASGMTADEYLAALLSVGKPPPIPWQAPAPDLSDQEKRAKVMAYINAPKEEIARLHAPHIAYLEAQLAEAANATPEEIAQADAEWEEHKRRMNAHRAVTGERPLFADVTPEDGA